jgi:hypothetical protein
MLEGEFWKLGWGWRNEGLVLLFDLALMMSFLILGRRWGGGSGRVIGFIGMTGDLDQID